MIKFAKKSDYVVKINWINAEDTEKVCNQSEDEEWSVDDILFKTL
ncbi:264_t:CDS:2 [Dentiscutata heterogama]|uniref:264_t:CDS:1 n=1 Tax=Dentiscutata heterogama TaxID=1316150 RepID=A0ACA9KKH2_9GLOM|nr:264_t:CDS:2 [Dentiscutata heterogama]